MSGTCNPYQSALPRALHVIAILGFALRVVASFFFDWVHHADVIFQYLEQGHRLAFGYGFIPWEYIFGYRNWMLPGTTAGILLGLSAIGLDQPELYIPVVEIVFCIVSISLVYGAYSLASRLTDNRAGIIAAFIASFWYEFVLFASKPTPEVIATYTFVLSLVIAVRSPTKVTAYAFGALSALTVLLRPQYGPAIAIAGLYVLLKLRASWSQVGKVALAALPVVAAYGLLDYVTWGIPFATIHNKVSFDYVYRISSVFGVSPPWYYGITMGIASSGLLLVMPVAGIWRFRETWFPLACAMSIVLFHSFIPHKEHRFVFCAVALLWIVGAIAISSFMTWQDGLLRRAHLSIAFAIVFLTISGLGLYGGLPGQSRVYGDPNSPDQYNINHLWDSLRKDESVRAILLLEPPWHETGGYYRLHRRVPVYSPWHLAEIKDSGGAIHPFITHVICRANDVVLPGFYVYLRSGRFEIQRRTSIEVGVAEPDVEFYEVPQPGVTDRGIRPRIRKRL